MGFGSLEETNHRNSDNRSCCDCDFMIWRHMFCSFFFIGCLSLSFPVFFDYDFVYYVLFLSDACLSITWCQQQLVFREVCHNIYKYYGENVMSMSLNLNLLVSLHYTYFFCYWLVFFVAISMPQPAENFFFLWAPWRSIYLWIVDAWVDMFQRGIAFVIFGFTWSLVPLLVFDWRHIREFIEKL